MTVAVARAAVRLEAPVGARGADPDHDEEHADGGEDEPDDEQRAHAAPIPPAGSCNPAREGFGPGVEGSRCLMPARSAPARRGKPRARRAAPRPAWPHLPELEQRQLDVIGLGLIALAVFFGFLVYVRSDGGPGRRWTVASLRWLLGAVHYGVPVALLAAGAILVLRPVLPAVRPFRAGALCLFAALCLGAGGRDPRPRPRRRPARPVGRRLGPHPRRHGRRGAGLGHLDAGRRRRRRHPRDLPVPRGRAAAHRRVGRRRAEGHDRLDHARDPRELVRRRAPPRRRRGAARARGDRGPHRGQGRRDARDRGPAGVRAGRARARSPRDPSFWSGEDRFPDLYGGEARRPPTELEPEPAPEPQLELPEPDAEPSLAEDEEQEGVAK